MKKFPSAADTYAVPGQHWHLSEHIENLYVADGHTHLWLRTHEN